MPAPTSSSSPAAVPADENADRPVKLSTSTPSRSSWLNLAWKLLLALVILLLMTLGSPLSLAVSWSLLNPAMSTLLLWGGCVVAIAAGHLFDGPAWIRWCWGALSVMSYVALALPSLVTNTPSRLIDAIGPVAALTLAAHLGRRDLQRALRDWALVMSVSLYAALGVQAMWLVIGVFGTTGPLVFLLSVLLPSILFEVLLLAFRRLGGDGKLVGPALALLLSTLLSTVIVAMNLLNAATDLPWLILFGLIIATLIGSGLLVSYLTRPLVEAASGANTNMSRARYLARALVELSHGPILISLALYIPLRLLR